MAFNNITNDPNNPLGPPQVHTMWLHNACTARKCNCTLGYNSMPTVAMRPPSTRFANLSRNRLFTSLSFEHGKFYLISIVEHEEIVMQRWMGRNFIYSPCRVAICRSTPKIWASAVAPIRFQNKLDLMYVINRHPYMT